MAHTRIPLSSCTSTKLIIDASRFMFLCTEDGETAEVSNTFSELDISTSTGHVCRYGDSISLTGVSDDFSFTSILFSIEYFMSDSLFCEHIGENL